MLVDPSSYSPNIIGYRVTERYDVLIGSRVSHQPISRGRRGRPLHCLHRCTSGSDLPQLVSRILGIRGIGYLLGPQ